MKTLKVDKKGYWHHNRAVSKCIYHVVFCPKYRRKILEPKIQKRLKSLIKSKQKEWNFKIIEQEIMLDHVHLLIQCAPDPGINEVIRLIKGSVATPVHLSPGSMPMKVIIDGSPLCPASWYRFR